jgi:hypothetical protein
MRRPMQGLQYRTASSAGEPRRSRTNRTHAWRTARCEPLTTSTRSTLLLHALSFYHRTAEGRAAVVGIRRRGFGFPHLSAYRTAGLRN